MPPGERCRQESDAARRAPPGEQCRQESGAARRAVPPGERCRLESVATGIAGAEGTSFPLPGVRCRPANTQKCIRNTAHTSCVFSLGNLRRNIWEHTSNIQSKELMSRAAYLPVLITSAWADTTNKKYAKGWKLWLSWCHRYPESQICPAYVSLFFNDLVLCASKKGRIETACLGIRWGHMVTHRPPYYKPFRQNCIRRGQTAGLAKH